MHRTLLWLAVGAFAIGSEGLMIAGILPRIAHDFDISVAQAGSLVTIFSLTYAVGSPVIAVATANWERRTLLTAAMGLFALANLAAAAAPAFLLLALGRALLALSAAAFMPAASAYAAMAVAPQMRGRALAFVYSGMTVALVIGVPLGAAVAAHLGWRSTFIGVAGLSAAALAGIHFKLPPVPNPRPAGLAERFAVARRPDVLAVISLTVLVLAGAFSVYTFIGAYLETAFAVPPTMVALFLILAGVAGALGNTLGGYAADRWNRGRFLILILVILTLAFGAVSVIPNALPGVFGLAAIAVVISAWGLFGWAFPALQQVRLLSIDPSLASITLGLNASAIYLGSAAGAAIASLNVEAHSVAAIGWVGAAFEASALTFLMITQRRAMRPAPAAG
jgi:predicted MFS family arabinose efflux permease